MLESSTLLTTGLFVAARVSPVALTVLSRALLSHALLTNLVARDQLG
jgi:hypothetical protein